VTTLRTFIAIELDDSIKDGLVQAQERLKEHIAPRSVRWVRPGAIHLTLKFLGNTSQDQVEAVRATLPLVVADTSPFSFGVGGLGCFPNTRRPRVVWIGIQEVTGALLGLRQAIEAHVAPLGFPTEKRPFRPHLTLGRVRRYANKSEVAQIGKVVDEILVGSMGEMTVTEVSYIKSDLRPSGAVYSTLTAATLTRA
jgi:2'-5' RNA ligase